MASKSGHPKKKKKRKEKQSEIEVTRNFTKCRDAMFYHINKTTHTNTNQSYANISGQTFFDFTTFLYQVSPVQCLSAHSPLRYH